MLIPLIAVLVGAFVFFGHLVMSVSQKEFVWSVFWGSGLLMVIGLVALLT